VDGVGRIEVAPKAHAGRKYAQVLGKAGLLRKKKLWPQKWQREKVIQGCWKKGAITVKTL